MISDFFSLYQARVSPIHRLDAAVKLVAAIICLFIIGLSAPSDLLNLALVFSFLVAVALVAKISLLFIFKQILFLGLFVFAMAGLAFFQDGGVKLFWVLLCKTCLALFVVILLNSSTRFFDLMEALARLRFPRFFVMVLTLTHRYLFVLFEQMRKMGRAQQSRTFRKLSKKTVWQLRARLAALLFVRTTDKAERVYAAMCARGWHG